MNPQHASATSASFALPILLILNMNFKKPISTRDFSLAPFLFL